MEPLRCGDRVKVIDGRMRLGETGLVGQKSAYMDESDVCVKLDRGEMGLFKRSQLLKIGDGKTV